MPLVWHPGLRSSEPPPSPTPHTYCAVAIRICLQPALSHPNSKHRLTRPLSLPPFQLSATFTGSPSLTLPLDFLSFGDPLPPSVPHGLTSTPLVSFTPHSGGLMGARPPFQLMPVITLTSISRADHTPAFCCPVSYVPGVRPISPKTSQVFCPTGSLSWSTGPHSHSILFSLGFFLPVSHGTLHPLCQHPDVCIGVEVPP